MPRTAHSSDPKHVTQTVPRYRARVPPIVSVRELRKSYGQIKAVDGVSFDVEEREIFALLGPNGAGKTTTVEILEGLRQADSGTAIVAGVDVRKNPSGVKERIGVQLQQSAFPENFVAKEIVELFALFYGKRVDSMALLRSVGLEDKAKQKQEKLSGGQRQRLSIAVALVNEPQVLFLDEPTTGLDPQARRNLWELVRAIRARGTTVFLTTHYLDEAEALCDRVAIMDAGQIVALDSPPALIQALLRRGFSKPIVQQQANLDDVFLDLTGHALREE